MRPWENSEELDLFHWLRRKVYRSCMCVRAMIWKRIITSRYNRKISAMKRMGAKKVKIVFLVNETSKWKYQQVYDLLMGNEKYEVTVVLTVADVDWHLAHHERIAKLLRSKAFFNDRNMYVEVAYDSERDVTVKLSAYKPDIVFYQQPWRIADNQAPKAVSKYALTLYAPYFVPTYVSPRGLCDTDFHRFLFAHFVVNDSLKNYVLQSCGRRFHAGDFVALGHPMVDYILKRIDNKPKYRCAIYAPHWSMPHPNNQAENPYNLSTFLDYGEIVLEFAKKHPEIKWIYKPHPSLYRCLIDCEIWSEEKTDAYYRQWELVGCVCYDGNYLPAFNESSVMITDCDSFLVEYALTGKPIVHLIGIGVGTRTFSPYGFLFDTYYRVENETELISALDEYVIKGADPNREMRLRALKDSGLLNVGAAERIVRYIENFYAL